MQPQAHAILQASILSILHSFWKGVWGNPSIFKVKSTRQSGRTVEYLDLEGHLQAVQFFCNIIMKKELLVVQEYHNAMDTFKSGTSYKNGACITGQPGIGTNIVQLQGFLVIMTHREVNIYCICCH